MKDGTVDNSEVILEESGRRLREPESTVYVQDW